jgi:hypothetical protein
MGFGPGLGVGPSYLRLPAMLHGSGYGPSDLQDPHESFSAAQYGLEERDRDAIVIRQTERIFSIRREVMDEGERKTRTQAERGEGGGDSMMSWVEFTGWAGLRAAVSIRHQSLTTGWRKRSVVICIGCKAGERRRQRRGERLEPSGGGRQALHHTSLLCFVHHLRRFHLHRGMPLLSVLSM